MNTECVVFQTDLLDTLAFILSKLEALMVWANMPLN